MVVYHMWYSSRTSIGDNFGFVSLFCFTLFFSFAICSHNEAGEGIKTIQRTEFRQVDFGRYADFSLTVSRLIHLASSVLVNRGRSISTTVFLCAVYLEYPLSLIGGTSYRNNTVLEHLENSRFYAGTLHVLPTETSYSLHQPSLAIGFLISYGGTHNGR